MGLPRLNTVEYFETLPVSKIEVKYRPFNVGEQKVLLQAIEEGEQKAISNALISLLRVCSDLQDSRLKIEQLSNTDLEWLFVKIRAKSVGENTKILLGCIDQPTCDGQSEIDVNFNDLEIEGEVKDGKIQLTDNIGVVIRVPSYNDVDRVLDIGIADGEMSTSIVYKLLNKCILQVFDADNVYDTKEFTEQEIDDFINELSVNQFNVIMEWFSSVPKLVYNAEFSCSKCGKEQTQQLTGLQNFFV
tara:strand:+ start:2477 stop:3211 length:735 start_codon:yes stop_codon:yes gene_type:complete